MGRVSSDFIGEAYVTATVTVWDEDVTSPSGRTGRSIRRKNGIIRGTPHSIPPRSQASAQKGQVLEFSHNQLQSDS